jgi:hypothetical protein
VRGWIIKAVISSRKEGDDRVEDCPQNPGEFDHHGNLRYLFLGALRLLVNELNQLIALDMEPADTSGFCALKAAKASSFSRLGTLK